MFKLLNRFNTDTELLSSIILLAGTALHNSTVLHHKGRTLIQVLPPQNTGLHIKRVYTNLLPIPVGNAISREYPGTHLHSKDRNFS